MKTKVGVGMSFSVDGNLIQPGAGNHDAGGGNGTLVERVEAGGIFGVGNREVVGVEDEEFRVGRVAQALGDGFALCRRGEQGRGEEHDYEKKMGDARRKLPADKMGP